MLAVPLVGMTEAMGWKYEIHFEVIYGITGFDRSACRRGFAGR